MEENNNEEIVVEPVINQVDETIETKSKKNKKKAIIVIIVLVIVCCLFGVGGWLLGTKFADNKTKDDTKVEENNKVNQNIEIDENDENNDANIETNDELENDEDLNDNVEEEEEIEFVPEETSVSNVIETFEMKFNKDSNVLKSDFEITKRKVLDQDDNEVYVHALYRKVYFNDKLLVDKHMIGVYDTLDEAKEDIETHSIKDYKAIKDSKNDEVYLLIDIYENDCIYNNSLSYWNSDSSITYIIDKNSNVLKKITTKYAGTGVLGVYVTEEEAKDRYFVLANDDDVMFDNLDKTHKYVLYPDNRIIDLYDKYLYYFTYQDGEECDSSERKIVIENGKVIDTKVRSFDFSTVSSAGQTC
jgi:hypothetical protein